MQTVNVVEPQKFNLKLAVIAFQHTAPAIFFQLGFLDGKTLKIYRSCMKD